MRRYQAALHTRTNDHIRIGVSPTNAPSSVWIRVDTPSVSSDAHHARLTTQEAQTILDTLATAITEASRP